MFRFVVMSAVLLGSASACAGAETAGTEPGYRVDFQSRLLGDATAVCTKSHVKIITPSCNVITVAQAPDWKVYQYNPVKKRIFEPRLEELKPAMSNVVALFSGNAVNRAPMKPEKSTTMQGIAALELRSPSYYREQQKAAFKSRSIDRGAAADVQLIVGQRPEISPKVGPIVSGVFGLPVGPGLPLECTFKDMDGDPHVMLKTVRAKAAPVNIQEFKVPAGYNKVATLAALCANDDVNAGVSELFDGLGELTKSPHQRK